MCIKLLTMHLLNALIHVGGNARTLGRKQTLAEDHDPPQDVVR